MWNFANPRGAFLAYCGGMIRTALVAVAEGPGSDARLGATSAAVRALLQGGAFVEVEYLVVPDEQAVIRSKLRILADGEHCDLILTLGGAGFGLRERAPEATREVLERELPGLPEALRRAWAERDPRAGLYRGVCGVRRRSLILNLPSGPEAADTALRAVLPGLLLALGALESFPKGV